MNEKLPKPPGPGRKFTKGDPRTKLGGRKKKTVEWKEAEDALREALPRILMMERNELQQLLASNPTGIEMLAAKFIHESPNKAVERFLGKMPEILTGKDGAPLIPAAPAPQLIDFSKVPVDQLLKLIQATEPKPEPEKK